MVWQTIYTVLCYLLSDDALEMLDGVQLAPEHPILQVAPKHEVQG